MDERKKKGSFRMNDLVLVRFKHTIDVFAHSVCLVNAGVKAVFGTPNNWSETTRKKWVSSQKVKRS